MQNLVKRQFADTSIGQVHYRYARPDHASGNRPLVMFHGSPSSSRALRKLIAELGKTRIVIGFDTLGQGDSAPHPDPEASFSDYAPIYAEALASMGEEFSTVDVFGTHTGARQAAEYAIGHPGAKGKAILDGMRRSSNVFWQQYSESVDLSQYIDQEGTQFFKAWSKLRDRYIYFPPYMRDAAHFRGGDMPDAVEMHEYALDVFKGVPTAHIPYRLALSYKSEERLPLISWPTLCTCATKDGPFVDLDYVTALIPGAVAKAHPHASKIENASDAEVEALCGMLAEWLDRP